MGSVSLGAMDTVAHMSGGRYSAERILIETIGLVAGAVVGPISLPPEPGVNGCALCSIPYCCQFGGVAAIDGRR